MLGGHHRVAIDEAFRHTKTIATWCDPSDSLNHIGENSHGSGGDDERDRDRHYHERGPARTLCLPDGPDPAVAAAELRLQASTAPQPSTAYPAGSRHPRRQAGVRGAARTSRRRARRRRNGPSGGLRRREGRRSAARTPTRPRARRGATDRRAHQQRAPDPGSRLFTETAVAPIVLTTAAAPVAALRRAGARIVAVDGESLTGAAVLGALAGLGLLRVLCEGRPVAVRAVAWRRRRRRVVSDHGTGADSGRRHPDRAVAGGGASRDDAGARAARRRRHSPDPVGARAAPVLKPDAANLARWTP